MAGGGRADGQSVAAAAPPVSPGEAAAFAAVVALFLALRFPLFRSPGLVLGWNSDAAIFGLMARAIAAGRDFPIFFWGQSYMGPLTSWVSVLASLFTGGVGPLAVRIAASAEVLGAITFYWLATRRAFGPGPAMVTALWLSIGPAWLLHFTTAPIGAEQMFLLSGLIAWVAVGSGLETARQWLAFGVLSGFGWWINQGVVFVLGAALIVAVLQSGWWSEVRPSLLLRERLTLRRYALPPPARGLVLAGSAGLAADALAGLLVDFGVDVPALWLRYPVLEPLTLFVLLHAGLAFAFRRGPVPRPPFRLAGAFAAGFAAGHAPVLVGHFAGMTTERYGFSAPLLDPAQVVSHAAAVAGDGWRFVGDAGTPLVGLVVVPALVAAVFRGRHEILGLLQLKPGAQGPRALGACAILLGSGFYLVSERAHPGGMRYIVAALPFVFAFAAEEMLRARLAGKVLATAIAVALLIPRVGDVRDVAGARAEAYPRSQRRGEPFAGAFDPRPVLESIRRQGYGVCYADYWVAYKLEFLSGGGIRFVPWRSLDRTPEESRRLNAVRVRKCLVSDDGVVSPLPATVREGATSEAARERLRRIGAESLATRPRLER